MPTLVISTEAPAVPGPPQGRWTYADWEALPDDGYIYEVIDGALYMTTAPGTFHQWIVISLVQYLAIPAKAQGLGYAFTSPIGVLMPGCDPVQPDFVFVRQSNASIIYDRRIRGVPDLIIEILSPNSAIYDTQVKMQAYAHASVPEYAIIDPRTHTLDYYRLQAPGQYESAQHFSGSDEIRFDCLPGVMLRIADLFAGAPDPTP